MFHILKIIYEYRAAIALRGQPAVWQFRYISFVDFPALPPSLPPSDVIRNVFKKYFEEKKQFAQTKNKICLKYTNTRYRILYVFEKK